MMKTLSTNLQDIVTKCSLCHDQCVSACPVVEMTGRQIAYPSRLASLAWELERGNLAADPETMRAMLHCIHCNACTSNCVYIDDPVDITPLVRYARQTLIESGQATPRMRQMRERIQAWGNPYQEIQARLFELKHRFEDHSAASPTLVIADAAELAYAPEAAQASLQLLRQFGYRSLSISGHSYTGGELWQYGYSNEALTIAETLLKEIERSQAEAVITLSPSSAFLLRKSYPDAMGVSVPARVLTVAEAIQARLDQAEISVNPPRRFALPGHELRRNLPNAK